MLRLCIAVAMYVTDSQYQVLAPVANACTLVYFTNTQQNNSCAAAISRIEHLSAKQKLCVPPWDKLEMCKLTIGTAMRPAMRGPKAPQCQTRCTRTG